jgi:hypothetical protein
MAKRYHVTLTEEERAELTTLIRRGKVAGYRIKHAQILLKLDEIPENAKWTGVKISEAYGIHPTTVSSIAKHFVENGMEAALGRKEQENRHRKIDGDVEAQIITIACSEPPTGRERWTLQLIADELVRLEVVDSISDTAICNTLKKTNASHGRSRSGVFRNRARSL